MGTSALKNLLLKLKICYNYKNKSAKTRPYSPYKGSGVCFQTTHFPKGLRPRVEIVQKLHENNEKNAGKSKMAKLLWKMCRNLRGRDGLPGGQKGGIN